MTLKTYDDRRRLTRELETTANWRDELQAKIERAELRFQIFGIEQEEIDALAAEVLKFKQVCAALCGTPQRLQERVAA